MKQASGNRPNAIDVFAANRAVGTVAFDTALVNGITRRRDVREQGSLRVRFPSPETHALSSVLVNTAGGVAGGDRFSVAIEAGEGTAVTLTTAAAEKIYRSEGDAAAIDVKLRVQAEAHLAWLPQETILFDRAKLARRFDIDLADNASLLLAEIVVFGRAAMNERVTRGAYTDRWRVRRDGRLIFAETLQLDGAVGDRLAQRAIADGGNAIATVLIVPGTEAIVERIRTASPTFAGEVGVSAWNGFALARFCAKDAAALRADVVTVLAHIDAKALPRLWLS
ncbi:urease accessory protein ureD [Afipia sp. P52-10]|uniref:urease accessory protein UreD n=1 Tax=Afipia sp. P52-10 TaxID=1429916 RepID=UPI0003DF1846|nr:urease accessory protein UreD [Afipia sp. P52-10]ETR77391.1 urease accessory protein ureD [Afipia sp. P52-10]